MMRAMTAVVICSALALAVAGESGTKVFSYTGSEQSWTVPDKVTSITVKVWGAGGGGGESTRNNGGGRGDHDSSGGGGGYTTGNLKVVPGVDLGVVVGQGGDYCRGCGPFYGGGGRVGHSSYYAGGGGGRSAIRMESRDVATAGGGGGGGEGTNDGYGGGGGGVTGRTSTKPRGGCCTGGTQSEKGSGGNKEGNQHQGSYSSNPLSGGGGGGYFGGGASGNNDDPGGGGSGYLAGLVDDGSRLSYPGTDGSSRTGGDSGAPIRVFNGAVIGRGGDPGEHGYGGRVEIAWNTQPVTTAAPKTTNKVFKTLHERINALEYLFNETGHDDEGQGDGSAGLQVKMVAIMEVLETQLRKVVESSSDGQKSLGESIDVLTSKLDPINSRLDTIDDDVTSLNDQLVDTYRRTELDDIIGNLTARLARIEGVMAGSGAVITDPPPEPCSADCSPSVTTTSPDGTDLDLLLDAPTGSVKFTSKECGAVDLCKMAEVVNKLATGIDEN